MSAVSNRSQQTFSMPSLASTSSANKENDNDVVLDFVKRYRYPEYSKKKHYLPDETDNNKKKEEENKSINVRPFEFYKPEVKPRNCNIPREIILQEWEGQVTSIHRQDGVFVANLIDKTAKDTIETEEAEFPIDDLSNGDRELLEEGAMFCWVIGREYLGTQCKRFSRINFRNLPQWSETELLDADKEAERLNAIEWD